MKHKRIRWLGGLLASMMAVTSLPVSALAAEPVEVIPTETIISNADNSMGGGISDSYVEPVEIVAEPVEVVPEEVISVEEAEEIISTDASYSGYPVKNTKAKTIVPGADALAQGNLVYLGKKSDNYTWTDERPTWIVLDPKKANNGTSGYAFLLSQELIGEKASGENGNVYFDKDGIKNDGQTYPNEWQGSDAQAWCRTFLSRVFSAGERAAILETNKTDRVFTSKVLYDDGTLYRTLNYGTSSLVNDRIFFLSAEEALTAAYGFPAKNYYNRNPGLVARYPVKSSAGLWWLRSPDSDTTHFAGLVDRFGCVYYYYHVSDGIAARPAFNLILKSVIFSSAAAGGKSSGPVGATALQAVATKDITEWKFTLKDEAHAGFTVTNKKYDSSTQILTFSYNGAVPGAKEYISAVVMDDNNIKYYGRLAQVTAASGTASVNLKGKYTAGDMIYVFNEQVNGDYETDYSSERKMILGDEVPVSKVEFWITKKLEILSGEQQNLNDYLDITPINATNQNKTWKSSNEVVATVDRNGIVTGHREGEAAITVTMEDGGHKATLIVKVPYKRVSGVALNKKSLSLETYKTERLIPTVSPADASYKKVTWKSSNTSVATVDANGLVKAVKAGSATITVTTEDGGFTASCPVTVKNPVVHVTGVSLNRTSATVNAGSTLQLTATVSPADATYKDVGWMSSDPSVATVSASGLVKAVKPGTATIFVITEDGGKTASCTVTVTAPQTSGSWKKTSDGKWWYKRADGTWPANKWERIGGKWYHFDAKGYMQTGWLKDGGKWYYLSGSGAMATGWQKISGKWYYFNASGVMQTGWVKVSGKWYYMNSSGAMQTGWQKISGKWYYFESSGVMLANTSKKIGKKTYTFDKNGVCTNP